MRKETIVVINPDGSVYPFLDIFKSENEEDFLVDGIKLLLESKGRRLGTLYCESKQGGKE
jgi:hypothetical protein